MLRLRSALPWLLAPALLACSPASGWKKSAELVRDGGVLVQRERKAGYVAEHPASVDAEALADDLCALSYVDRFVVGADMQPVPAWPCAAARAVASGIATGLGDAGPDERIRFWVRWSDDDQTLAWYVPHERHTRGIAYWRGGSLELAFDRVAMLEGEAPHSGEDPSTRASRRIRLVPPPGTAAVELDGKAQPMQLRWASVGTGTQATEPDDLSPAERARLELLGDLLDAGEIDRASYERRRNELLDATRK